MPNFLIVISQSWQMGQVDGRLRGQTQDYTQNNSVRSNIVKISIGNAFEKNPRSYQMNIRELIPEGAKNIPYIGSSTVVAVVLDDQE